MGGSSGGMRNVKRSQRSIAKPAASISRSVSRARWQPPDSRGQTVASAARCSARSARRGEATCSKKRSSPPGRSDAVKLGERRRRRRPSRASARRRRRRTPRRRTAAPRRRRRRRSPGPAPRGRRAARARAGAARARRRSPRSQTAGSGAKFSPFPAPTSSTLPPSPRAAARAAQPVRAARPARSGARTGGRTAGARPGPPCQRRAGIWHERRQQGASDAARRPREHERGADGRQQ